jgi:hypothetical protein
MGNALLAATRLGHGPVLAEADRILRLDPVGCPPEVRAAAAFAAGVLGPPGKAPDVNFLSIYGSEYEAPMTKIEAIKALGNLRAASTADRLKAIASAEPDPALRWLAHWAYERCSNTRVPYTPPIDRREPPVSISDLPRQ